MINEEDSLLNKDNDLQELFPVNSISDTRAILFGTFGIFVFNGQEFYDLSIFD